MITCQTFTITFAYEPAPTRTVRGLLETPKPAKSKAVFCWLAVALYRRRVRLLRWQTTAGDEIFTACSHLEISRTTKKRCSTFRRRRWMEHYQLINSALTLANLRASLLGFASKW
jgi:hypothetical protein